MKLSLTRDEDWQTLLGHLPADYAALAKKHKQVQTQYGNAKIRDAETLLRFIFLHAGADLPLRQTVALMAEAGGPSVSPMRLHKKMARAAPYLRALVERMVAWPSKGAAELWGGYVLAAVDATTICGPGAVGTDARIHTKLRVADVSISAVEVTDETGGETFTRFKWERGELAVADRAYCNHRGIQHVLDDGADVLVRYRLDGIELSTSGGVTLDVLEAVAHLEVGETADLEVQVKLVRGQVRGRLVAYRLPEEAADRARVRLRRDKGKDLTPRGWEVARYVLLFTTVPRQRLDAERCLQAYRLRWQIELQFKRWKSLCGFDVLPNFRDDTTLAWIYAKVLLGALLDRMASIPTELSPPERHAPIGYLARDVVRPVEAHEHPLAPTHRCSPAALAR
jgi:Transposase DDE domain